MAQLPQIQVRIVDGELLEMLSTLFEQISKINITAFGNVVSNANNRKGDEEFKKVKELYLYAMIACDRFIEIQNELEAKLNDLEKELNP